MVSQHLKMRLYITLLLHSADETKKKANTNHKNKCNESKLFITN